MSKKYPLSYEKYEKSNGSNPHDKQKVGMDKINKLLKNDPNFIRGLYEDTCFRYDRQDLYGDDVGKFSMTICWNQYLLEL